MQHAHVIVIGAGIGGLAAALELSAAGVRVTVLEADAMPGGKLRPANAQGLPIDAGPTVFTMRWVFEALFDAVGERCEDHLRLARADLLARHAWVGTRRLDLHADVGASADAIGQFAGPQDARNFLRFCARARSVYQALETPFLRAARPSGPVALARRFGWRGFPDLLGISPFGTLWAALEREFGDPRLRQLFGRYATYCGSSPFQAPATLMLVAHVEQDGVWLVEGGMHRLATVLANLATARGCQLRFGARVESLVVRAGRAAGVRLAGGEALDADAVVFNGDCAALAQGLLGAAARSAAPPTPPERRSLSAVTWTGVARTHGFPLVRHNVFFSDDYAGEFEALFGRRALPAAPTVYVCAQDRTALDAGAAPGPERLLCLVNAPATGDAGPLPPAALDACETAAFGLLQRCGLAVDASDGVLVRTTPADFHARFPGTGGALYGIASHGWQASFSRPGARSRLPGLYLAGGSTHPGPGVPMAALSGRQASASVLHDLAASRRSAA